MLNELETDFKFSTSGPVIETNNNNYEDDEDVMKNNLTTSEKIIKRLNEQHINFFANDNISSFISDEELSDLQYEVEEKAEALLRSLVIDTNRDHNTRNTAKRIAKMLLRETLNGRYESPPQITSFPNVKLLDEMVITKAEIKSLCSHHFQNISGLPSTLYLLFRECQRTSHN